MYIKTIANDIYEICYDVEKNIVGHSEIDATLWAKANSIRHSHTIHMILEYIKNNNKKELKILNASGLSCGHQDFSIVNFLRKNIQPKIEWKAYENPNSKYLSIDLFKKYLKGLGITIELSDFSKTANLYGEKDGIYDIVIFTEIAEHLDHSTLLNLLISIRKKMREDAILIITTPNLLSLPNRIKFFLGHIDSFYWGHGTQNLEKGLYGHIVNYDINRLIKLLNDIGYHTDKAYTFTFGYSPTTEKNLIKHLILKIIDFIALFFKNSRCSIFIAASKTHPQKIPFQT
ncbi:MAG: hypothetical protein AABY84_12885 [Candidatus Firestonebacteria bacterium]